MEWTVVVPARQREPFPKRQAGSQSCPILLPNHFGAAVMEVDMEIIAWLIVLVFFVGVVVFSLS
jgi:hypothetical protein